MSDRSVEDTNMNDERPAKAFENGLMCGVLLILPLAVCLVLPALREPSLALLLLAWLFASCSWTCGCVYTARFRRAYRSGGVS